MKKILIMLLITSFYFSAKSQNVGIGTTTPIAKLHIKGSADTSQLVIDAHSQQNNRRPLIRLRNSSGDDLMWINSDDSSNVFIGKNAGKINFAYSAGGKGNTAIGLSVLSVNYDGGRNTGTGSNALRSNTIGNGNTANGESALGNNTTGNVNTANGLSALNDNTTGSSNTANGYWSLFYNISGSNNTANGIYALANNTTGMNNTAGGAFALKSNNGSSNTAIGYEALYGNTTGSFNTAVGYGALYNTTASSNNTSIGYHAGFQNNLGDFNTLLGFNTHMTANGIFNSIVIGKDAAASASNQVRIGNNVISSIGGFADWTNISDGRVKKNIKENVPGLAFISQLKPVTYNLDLDAADKIIKKAAFKDSLGNIIKPQQVEIEARMQKEKIVYSGFIAQDVEKAAKELGFDFSGVDAAKNENDLYGLRYAEFVVPLVKAVQEQQQMISDLQKRTKFLEEQNKLLLQLLDRK